MILKNPQHNVRKYDNIDTRVHPVCVQPFRTTDGHFVQRRMSGCLGGINFVSSSIVLKSLTSQFGWDPLGQSAETHWNMIFLVLFCGCDWLSIWLSLGSGLWLFIFPQLLHSQFSGPEPNTEHPKPAMARGCNRDVHSNNGIYDCSITEPMSNPCRYSLMSIFIR